jgi:hypothetical protein
MNMTDFPAFMKQSANRIVTGSQATPGVEGRRTGASVLRLCVNVDERDTARI